MLRFLRWIPLLLVLTSFACASAGRQAAWEKQGGAQGTQTSTMAGAAALQQAEEAWNGRDDRAKLEQAIEAWEKAIGERPNDAETMVKLARAYYFLVDGHVALEKGDVNDQKLTLHQKGVDWGEKALLIVDPKFGEKMRGGAEFEDAIKEINKEAIPAAYWYCTNLSRFALAKGLSARLFYKDRVAAAMSRIMELDRPFFHAAADRFFGAYYSALPGIAGKDTVKSAEHFEKAIGMAPHYLPNKLLKADFLAVELDDEEMYRKLLKEVLDGADGDDPDYAPENRAAKRHAQRLMETVGDRF